MAKIRCDECTKCNAPIEYGWDEPRFARICKKCVAINYLKKAIYYTMDIEVRGNIDNAINILNGEQDVFGLE